MYVKPQHSHLIAAILWLCWCSILGLDITRILYEHGIHSHCTPTDRAKETKHVNANIALTNTIDDTADFYFPNREIKTTRFGFVVFIRHNTHMAMVNLKWRGEFR